MPEAEGAAMFPQVKGRVTVRVRPPGHAAGVAVLAGTTRPLRLTHDAEKIEDPTSHTNWAQ